MASAYYDVTVCFAGPDRRADDGFEEFLDCVIDELMKLEREVDVTASLTRRVASFVLLINDLSVDSASQALSDLRTALHAVDCGTPKWPTGSEILGMNVVENPVATDTPCPA